MKLIILSIAFLSIIKLFVSEPSPTIVPINGGVSGNGTTTRYWDCCKPSCSWAESIKAKIPVTSCAIDGKTPIDAEAQSGCGNGTSYMCSNQQPWVVNSTLAYGFAAVSFSGGADTGLCCSCLLLQFQGDLAGKQMLVQYTNTGGDLNVNHFDIAIPGGGVGIFFEGCMSQWNASETGWGERYGGVSSEKECSELPAVLQPGCRFRFEFMEGVSNPPISFYQVKCPSELVALTGCEL